MPALILLVNGDKNELHQIESVLIAAGCLVAGASSLRRAAKLLNSVIPDLLIAHTRLRNLADVEGLQLAALGRRDHPNLPVIITHGSHDQDLESEAKSRGMAFIVNPLENPQFLECVAASLGEQRPHHAMVRQWPRKRVAPVPARVDSAPAQLIDVSYEGLRLELEDPGDSDAAVFEVALPAAGVNLKTKRVWRSRGSDTEEYWWGMALVDVNPALAERWRQFVDSIPETAAAPTRR
jgi:DNA-binding response OmpR family regulator